MKKLLAALFLLLAPVAFAQPVQQSGSVTPGHAAKWITNGVVGDAGTAANGALTSLGVTNNGGPGICVNSAPVTQPYNQLCLWAATNGQTKISTYAYGGATDGGFIFDDNGSTQGFPLVNPLPVVANNGACFSNTGGTLKDCGYSPLTNSLTSGFIFVGNVSNVATGVAMSGDCALVASGAITCTKTNGVAFAASATTDTTNASNISSGTLNTLRLPSPFTSGTRSGNTSEFASVSGALTSGNCIQSDASGNFVDAGQLCSQPLTNWVNVKASPYNAVCDGTTDDAAHIQAALDSGNNVYIPANATCAIGSGVYMHTSGQQFVGFNQHTSALKALSTSVTKGLCVVYGTENWRISNFTMLGVATTQVTHIAIYVNSLAGGCTDGGVNYTAFGQIDHMFFDGVSSGTNGWTMWGKLDNVNNMVVEYNVGQSIIGVQSGFGYGFLAQGSNHLWLGNYLNSTIANWGRHAIYDSATGSGDADNIKMINNTAKGFQDSCLVGNSGANDVSNYWIIQANFLSSCGQGNLVNTTGNITSGSPIITNIPSTAHMFASGTGYGVTGTGIPLGAYIVSVDSATQITISANATATTTGVAIRTQNNQAGAAISLAFESPATARGADQIISNNIIFNSGGSCINGYGASRTIVTENDCNDFSTNLDAQPGIFFGPAGSSDRTTIAHNILRKAGSDLNVNFIELQGVINPQVHDNTCVAVGTANACVALDTSGGGVTSGSISGNISQGSITNECLNCAQTNTVALTGWGAGRLTLYASAWGSATTITAGGSINMAGTTRLNISCTVACNVTGLSNVVQNQTYYLCWTNSNGTLVNTASYLIGGVASLNPTVTSGATCGTFVGEDNATLRQITALQNSS